jgi:hypothetical protein
MKTPVRGAVALCAMLAAMWCLRREAVAAPASAPSPGPAVAERLALIDAVAPSVCRVEYVYQYDKGEAPRGATWNDTCPTCGQAHASATDHSILEERPMELPAYVISPTRVLAPDFTVHPRFIKSVAVRYGQQVVQAKVAGYYRNQEAVLMELARPLTGAKPLSFDEGAKGPFFAVKYSHLNGQWTISVKPSDVGTVLRSEDGHRFRSIDLDVLITDKAGSVVGVLFNQHQQLDDSWKGAPAGWPMIGADEMARLIEDCRKRSDAGVLRVTLNFRSPKARSQDPYSPERAEGSATESQVLGVLIDPTTVLVLAELAPGTTARMERIAVHPAQGKAVAAKFAGSIEEYGCFLAKLESPMQGAVAMCPKAVLDLREAMLVSADIRVQGEKRLADFEHGRVRGFSVGYKGRMFMQVMPASLSSFVFDLEGNLAAMPVTRRQKVTSDAGDYGSRYPQLTPVRHLAATLAEPAKFFDPNNVPLSELEENRIAWMGVELQPLNRELARANGVSDLTLDGATGGLVTYVYANSPAAKAGIEPGDILLRLHVPGESKPVDIQVESYVFFSQPFPWDQLATVPESYFDRVPTPWQPLETGLSRTLMQIGLGKPYTAEVFHDGKAAKKDFTVSQCPTYYESAPRHKDDRLGVTVRELTFEVRRYFQKKADEPGVIISKVEKGSAAAKAGLRPYELILQVNDTPIRTPADFAKALAGATDLRLDVKQLTKGRLVKVKVPSAPPATAAADDQ